MLSVKTCKRGKTTEISSAENLYRLGNYMKAMSGWVVVRGYADKKACIISQLVVEPKRQSIETLEILECIASIC